jgi:hypothetical protein
MLIMGILSEKNGNFYHGLDRRLVISIMEFNRHFYVRVTPARQFKIRRGTPSSV